MYKNIFISCYFINFEHICIYIMPNTIALRKRNLNYCHAHDENCSAIKKGLLS